MNRKFKKLVRKTAAVMGAGTAICTTTVLPCITPVTNVYAAVDSYDNEQAEFAAKLSEAKKVNRLKITEKDENITVKASEADNKKKELAEKIDSETAKLQAAIDKQKSNNAEAASKNANPDYVLENYNTAFSKEKLINMFSTDGKLDVDELNDINFKNATGITSNMSKPTKELYERLLSVVEKLGRGGITYDVYNNGINEVDSIDYNTSAFLIPKVNDIITIKNIFEDSKTGKICDLKMTVAEMVTDKDLSILNPEQNGITQDELNALQVPIIALNVGQNNNWSAISLRGSLRKIKFNMQIVESGTSTPVVSDLAFTGYDVDNLQFLNIPQADKTLLSEASTITLNGTTALGKEEDEPNDPTSSVTYLLRDKSSFDFEWGTALQTDFLHENWLDVKGLNIDIKTAIPTSEKVTVTKYNLNIIEDPTPDPDPTPDSDPVIQKGSVAYIDKTTNKTLETKAFSGESGAAFGYNTSDTIKKYTDMGYKFVSSDFPSNPNNQVFDEDPNIDQDFTVILEQVIVDIPPEEPGYGVTEDELNKTLKRTIFYKYENRDGKDVYTPITQTVKLTR